MKSDELWNCHSDALIVPALASQPTIKNLRNWNVDYKRSSVTVNARFEPHKKVFMLSVDMAEYEGKIDLIAVEWGEAPIAINRYPIY